MFKLAAVKKVWWLVVIQIPQDGGNVQKVECDLEFEILSQAEHDELLASNGNILDRVVHGWKRVQDEHGEHDLPFSAENKARFLDISYVRVGVLRAYYEACQGRKAERKN